MLPVHDCMSPVQRTCNEKYTRYLQDIRHSAQYPTAHSDSHHDLSAAYPDTSLSPTVLKAEVSGIIDF